jgi:hypothetical protein
MREEEQGDSQGELLREKNKGRGIRVNFSPFIVYCHIKG